ncbi:MAG: SPOR domain-containing protein [gamma proteobacterium symbiont of Bathyaustriella thionipta]|nr:SPOR domain-containing protein [gamma proteobacterium symbiont of Bathyaustriella thionipta]MCU7948562.1 SPOR domain-containing protein [gamma proteobacterium symbiont of Bathyaustriella thionipta]MCU7954479.1 SPOR domain-containing protein [gamma proteobacterium symbiont of Bathyaustriella thionipta]MCU7955160.1 SPOR domain-containing protein [gamma proteobacterium symbiont of Bathyaustriella thionipta]MCU7966039.1 SPOR domain-containing protein [gamma proteobacterium symbiont of Bathyaustr
MSQLDRLGLRENPFNKNIEQRYFYADKNRAQILESTEHLIEYSSNFQVIIGESGIGKSHLLETLASRIDNNWRVAKITIAEQHDTLSLIQAILDSFGAIIDDHVELLEALETQLAEINQLGFKPVLFVDDAQGLSIDSLRFLIQLSQQKQDEVPYINIVLFATTQLAEFLQNPELRDFRDVVHLATLGSLDKEGVSGYLRHKMAVAGFDRETPFTPRIIDSIFGDSDGIPQKIDFFADKFLTSSGKADNYIEPDNGHKFEMTSQSVLENQEDDFNPEQENNLMDSLIDDDLTEHRSDRAEVQLNRLAEKFEEIEQLSEQSRDDFLAEGDLEYDNDFKSPVQDEDEQSASGLPKFVIPTAVLGILIVALMVLNTVFEQADQNSTQADKEKIDLLPLELPPEKLLVEKKGAEDKVPEKANVAKKAGEKVIAQAKIENTEQTERVNEKASETVVPLELIENSELTQEKENASDVIVNEAIDTLVVEQSIDKTPKPVDSPAAVLKSVEPEPVIGSHNRQYITIRGSNLKKDTHLMVSWAGNKKEFSEEQTPEQWRYINNNQIKLHLNTGITPQQWTVSAKHAEGLQSPEISFDVVKPYISKLSIKGISPSPFIGSDKRQSVSIEGEGFSKQTVVELRWDKNKKHFSSRLTHNQFQFINSNQIKLFIATGIKKRKWTVVVISPAGKTSTSSFLVVSKTPKNKKSVISSSDNKIKGESWLQQQSDTHYTIQLFGSHNKQAINELVKKYALQGDILRYTTQRNAQNWYTMTYGNYPSKQDAEAAVKKLDPALTKTPWIRNFASIKDQLSIMLIQTPAKVTNQQLNQVATASVQTVNSGLPKPDLSETVVSRGNDEAWIWTQNPADYTIQLIALSSEAGIKNYIEKYAIAAKSAYFKTIKNGKTLYVLIYGSYADKNSAQQAGNQLALTIKDSKPWVRNFSTVHGMMTSH